MKKVTCSSIIYLLVFAGCLFVALLPREYFFPTIIHVKWVHQNQKEEQKIWFTSPAVSHTQPRGFCSRNDILESDVGSVGEGHTLLSLQLTTRFRGSERRPSSFGRVTLHPWTAHSYIFKMEISLETTGLNMSRLDAKSQIFSLRC